MRKLSMAMALALLWAPVGCGSGDGGGRDAGAARDVGPGDGARPDAPPATRAVFPVKLGPGEVVPALTGRAYGVATVTADAKAGTLRVALKVTGVGEVTSVALMAGEPGVRGRLAATVARGPVPAAGIAADVTRVETAVFKDVAALARAVIDGRTYLEVTSRDRPSGALRGHVGPAKLAVDLSDFQLVPAPAGAGGILGEGTVRLDGRLGPIEVRIDPLDGIKLADVATVDLRLGGPGASGAKLVELARGAITLPFRVKVGEASLVKTAGIATLADLRHAILSGRTHIVVTTKAKPAGAVRGHVGPASLFSAVSGNQLSPPPPIVYRGALHTTIAGSHASFAAELHFPSNLGLPVDAVTYHVGGLGKEGNEAFFLGKRGAKSPLTASFTARDIASKSGLKDMGEAITALLSGAMHVMVWGRRSSGDLVKVMRGHVGPAALAATLTGKAEVPPVTTRASGKAEVIVDGAQRTVRVRVTFTGLGEVTAAHIHLGATGKTGGVLFDLAKAGAKSPLSVTLTERDFKRGTAVLTFPGAVDALLAGLCYVNVHTKAHPAGELRGQLVPAGGS